MTFSIVAVVVVVVVCLPRQLCQHSFLSNSFQLFSVNSVPQHIGERRLGRSLELGLL
jgi:hypothetical protein